MHRIQALDLEDLWAVTHGHPEVTIAVLDGPVATQHASLKGASLKTASIGAGKQPGAPESQRHGTHVVSEIFANHGEELSGIAPGCSGLLIPVFGGTVEGGLAAASQIDLARAIQLAVDEGADVINISGGQLSPAPEADGFLAKALRYCESNNVLVVAAAGNNGCECLHIPAGIPTVLAVGAFDPETGKPLEFSNWAKEYRGNGILAPGKNVPGAQVGGGTAFRSGTSFAAPIVAGVAGLLLSIQREQGLEPNAAAVRAALLDSATRCDSSTVDDCRPYLVGKLHSAAAHELLNATHIDASEGSIIASSQMAQNEPDELDTARAPLTEVQPACEVEPSSSASVGSTATYSHSGDRPGPDRLRPVPNTSSTGPTHLAGRPIDTQENEMLNELMDGSGDQGMENVVPSAAPTSEDLAPITAPVEPTHSSEGTIDPSGDCGCDGPSATAPQLVFALGELGYDLVTEARKDSLWQAMNDNPYDWRNLAKHLAKNPWDAEAVTWTLRIDATPIYAIQPVGAYASEGFELLAKLLIGQIDSKQNIERVSVPGYIAGSTRLTNGITVPVIVPTLRGVFAWDTDTLVKAVKASDGATAGVTNFLERVYYELRNMGQSPQERAINFAATNAFQVSTVFHEAAGVNHELDLIEVKRSPICRQDSDCWDVMLTFFDPSNDRAARRVHRFTVDVSDVVPCTVGRVRTWSVR